MDQARAQVAGDKPSLRPTGEFWHYLWAPAVFALLALHLRQDLVFLLGTLVLGCTLAAWPLCRRNLASVTVVRDLPARARVGEPLAVRYRIRNTGRHAAVGVEVEDLRLRGPGPGAVRSAQRLEVECLEPGAEVAGSLEALFSRRGPQVVAGPRLTSRFPLGVFRARRVAGPGDEVLVWPREGRPTPLLRRRVLESGAEADLKTSRRPGADDLFGLREQRAGDDPRRVRWRASARAGRPVVAEWRARLGRDALLVLGRGPVGDPGAYERAVSVTASVWRLLDAAGRPALLLADGLRVHARGRGLALGLDLLARVRLAGVRRTAARLRRLGVRGGSRHVIVVGGADEVELLRLAAAAAGRDGSVTRVPVEAREVGRWVEGLA